MRAGSTRRRLRVRAAPLPPGRHGPSSRSACSGRRSGGQQVRRDPRRAPDRACSARPTAKLSLGPGRSGSGRAEWFPGRGRGRISAIRRQRPTITPARRASSNSSSGVGFVGGRTASGQQAGVDVPSGDRGPVQQPHAPGRAIGPAAAAVSRRHGAGMWVCSCQEPCAIEQPGQLADEEGVAAASPPQSGALTLAATVPCRRSRRPSPRHPPGRGRRGAAAARGRPGRASPVGRFGVPVRTDQQHPAVGQCPGQESEQPQRRLVRPLQVVERRPAAAASAARPARQRATDSNSRNSASAAAPASMDVAGLTVGRRAASRRRRARSTGRPVARRTCDHGQYGGAPCPPSRSPAKDRAVRAGLARSARPAPRSCRCRPRR